MLKRSRVKETEKKPASSLCTGDNPVRARIKKELGREEFIKPETGEEEGLTHG